MTTPMRSVLRVAAIFWACVCWALSPAVPLALPNQPKPAPNRHLAVVKTITSPSELAQTFMTPLRCDADGNLYLNADEFGVTAIRKVSPDGKRLAVFQPNANPDLSVGMAAFFTLDLDGELYQIEFPNTDVHRYVFVFKPDGSYKAKIKLDPGFVWMPGALAVFPSGYLLINGERYDTDPHLPLLSFTGLFSPDGTLRKELTLEDDDALHELGKSADPRVTNPRNPTTNHAIGWSLMEPAQDGNVYLMRWMNPAIFYAISPGGAVVRRFTVDPGDPDYRPVDMHISGGRIAVFFTEPQTYRTIMKIVDLEGHELATYDEVMVEGKRNPDTMLGLAFACYTSQPERFTFLLTGENDHLVIRIAEPR